MTKRKFTMLGGTITGGRPAPIAALPGAETCRRGHGEPIQGMWGSSWAWGPRGPRGATAEDLIRRCGEAPTVRVPGGRGTPGEDPEIVRRWKREVAMVAAYLEAVENGVDSRFVLQIEQDFALKQARRK